MSLHDDLLAVAGELARLDASKPRQATLRRAISTAYYAVFHMLLDEAVAALVVNAELRFLLARAFNHGDMEKACRPFAAGNLPAHLSAVISAVPADLQTVARMFIKLQEVRHDADYNRRARYRRQQALDAVADAQTAFDAWTRVRSSAEAKVFLTSLLVGDRWRR